MVNNVVYNYGTTGVEVGNRGIATSSAIVGNVFLSGPDSVPTQPVFVRGASNAATVVNGSHIYLADNTTGSVANDPWSLAFVESPVTQSMVAVSSAPTWPPRLVAAPTANGGVLNAVLTRAGARPADRDSADVRIIDSVRNRKGQIINCVVADGSQRCAKNAGGWPSAVSRSRYLTLPANPDQVNSDGYTNLEKWLQQLAAEVEGRAEVPMPPANAQLR